MHHHRSSFLFERRKLKHFFVILALYILGLVLVCVLKPPYMVNILIVYLPGFIYGLLLLKNSARKVLIFGLVSLLFIIPVEILARMTDSWDVLSIFPRILQIAPLENIVYALFNIMYVLVFYEYFYDNDRNREISPRWKLLLVLFVILFAATFIGHTFFPHLMLFNYWIIGLAVVSINIILLFLQKRHILKRLLVPAIVFGGMYALHEAVSMHLGHWWWPGEYLYPLELLGHTYPMDDFVIWILLSNVSVIAGYEVMWD